MNKPDITSRADIQRLIDTFYAHVRADAEIGYIFNEVARVDWPAHLPVMYDFWEFLLLNGQNYTRNPIQKHLDLHSRHPLTAAHFDRWVALFRAAVDELFAGPVAEDAKTRAWVIAETWKVKFGGTLGVLPK